MTFDEMLENIKTMGETERQTIEAAQEMAEKMYAREKRAIGKGVKFQRIRRITGYLVGTTDRFNDGKKAEERDRVKHVGPAGQVLGDFTGSSQLGQQAKLQDLAGKLPAL